VQQLTELMLRFSDNKSLNTTMGNESFKIISDWDLSRFSNSFRTAAQTAVADASMEVSRRQSPVGGR
jgi:hypothetical protein